MMLTDEQKNQLDKLAFHRDLILSNLSEIENILQTYFPSEHEKAIQFYIPQITTALYEDRKWLSRGEYSLQNSIDNLKERCKNSNGPITSNSISKYLK